MKSELEPIDPELGDLLARARRRDAGDASFDDEACERLLARVERALAAPSSAPPSTFVARLGSAAPIATACAAVAIAGVIAGSMRSPRATPLPPPVVVEAAGSIAPPPEIATPPGDEAARANAIATVSVADLPSPTTRPAPRAIRTPKGAALEKRDDVAPAKVPNEAGLAGELRIVDGARAAIVDRQYEAALRLLAEHETRYPDGQLAQQRERLWIQALVATGDEAQARSRADAFRRRHPSGLLLPSVERALGGAHVHDR